MSLGVHLHVSRLARAPPPTGQAAPRASARPHCRSSPQADRLRDDTSGRTRLELGGRTSLCGVLVIREARLEDEDVLSRIHLATWTSDVSPGSTPEPDSSFFDSDTRVEDVLVAEDDGAVLGYVWLHQPGPLPSHEHVLSVGLPRRERGHVRRGRGRIS